MKVFLGLMAAVLLFAGIGSGQERYVKPVDRASEDASFLAFRTKLIAAVERKDAAFILSILDPKINLSFGGAAGVADFKRIWKINSPKTQFWQEFTPIIKNGGTWRNDEGQAKIFYAPYSFDTFPEDIDMFTHYVVLGSNVNLREAPSVDSKVVSQLSYNIVTVEDDPDSEAGKVRLKRGWSKLKTLGGLSGWVKNEYVRSPIDYRAGFEKKRGAWKMTALIAGD